MSDFTILGSFRIAPDGATTHQCCVTRDAIGGGLELCMREAGHGWPHLYDSSLMYQPIRAVRWLRRRATCVARGHRWLAYKITPHWYTYEPGDEGKRVELVCGRCSREFGKALLVGLDDGREVE